MNRSWTNLLSYTFILNIPVIMLQRIWRNLILNLLYELLNLKKFSLLYVALEDWGNCEEILILNLLYELLNLKKFNVVVCSSWTILNGVVCSSWKFEVVVSSSCIFKETLSCCTYLLKICSGCISYHPCMFQGRTLYKPRCVVVVPPTSYLFFFAIILPNFTYSNYIPSYPPYID